MSNEPQEQTDERAESETQALLRSILGVLGYDAVEQLTAQDVVAVIGAWLGLVTLASSEPTSPAAELWRTAYAASLHASPMAAATARQENAREDADAAVLAFVRRFPCRFEPVDRQAADDLAAMRAALDEQTEATERARRDADVAHLMANSLREGVCAALGVPLDGGGYDILTLIRDNTRDARKFEDALVPLPKPERVEPGQRWAFVDDVAKLQGDTAKLLMGEDADRRWMIESQDWYYLGPAPTSEG